MTRVWDLPVRLLHAALALAVAAAAFTGAEVHHADLHVAAGAAAAAVVALRLGWGLVGERWSRFSAFGTLPGHAPLAALSAVWALGLVALLAVTGVVVLAGEERRGWLATAISVDAGLAAHAAHAALALGLAAWWVVHLAGVLRASLLERQDLVRAMVDGHKRAAVPPVRPRRAVAIAMAAAIGLAALAAVPAPAPLPPVDREWQRECGDCHLPFPPSLLPARSWDALLASEEHFGETLGLDAGVVERLGAWARDRAAEARTDEHAARIARSVPPDEVPPRITGLAWWRDQHAGVADAGLRCVACHEGAEAGRFDVIVERRMR